ncbi:MAG: S41 family peptidase [Cyclobacteriaceae bacterium]
MVHSKKYFPVYLLLPLFFFLASCEKDEVVEQIPDEQVFTAEDSLKMAVFQVMDEWYLWNDEIPEVNVDEYETADALMDAMMNKTYDKWSYIENEEDYDALFDRGEYKGYGIRMAFDDKGQLRVAFVYNDSPFGRAGVDRSWIIDKINGASVKTLAENGTLNEVLAAESHTFDLIKPDGTTATLPMSKSTIGMNTVTEVEVFQLEGAKVGYLSFVSFLATSEAELDVAFQQFKAENIDELIVDLRYNGGGRVNIAEMMASNIMGNGGVGRNFLKYRHNDDKSAEYDQTVPFNSAKIPLDLDRLIVITSSGSASASELLINGLLPFVDVVLIGDDTYGKPVGSRPFRFGGYAINPISFKVLNDIDEGEYFGGLQADAYVVDDLSHKLGDPEEARLKEALYFIENGSFTGLNARSSQQLREQQIELEGIQREIGAY